ncbi:MAG TPA: hypothetical protein VMZ33_05690 [Candidatus Limnocylindrales bacterium]|nr:hypothetical protein [Candidatus Limnocylindrales bacterium]
MDPIARHYVVLSLALGEHIEGFVDAYYGPAELKQQAIASGAALVSLAEQASALRERVANEEPDEQRRRWLDRQLVAIETLARRANGEETTYLDEVERCFDARPERTPAGEYANMRNDLERLLPGTGSLAERLKQRDQRLTIPRERVESVITWVVDQARAAASEIWPVPAGESLAIELVTDQPWSAYNWYDGDLRSRIEVNTDLPTRAMALPYLATHETFPGHHLEHAWKEQRLVREHGRLEASVQLINTPEAYISEGLAEVGGNLLFDPAVWQDLLIGICERSGIRMDAEDAEREWQTIEAMRALKRSSGDAALQLHVEGRSQEEVVQFLIDEALRTREQAEKSMEFLTHPLWRTYVFCYAGGEELLTTWCRAAGDAQAQRDRFFRLLTEQITPSGVAEELAAT